MAWSTGTTDKTSIKTNTLYLPRKSTGDHRFLTPQQMAAHQLPHLAWPKPGSPTPPPMLSFYSFVTAEVVQF